MEKEDIKQPTANLSTESDLSRQRVENSKKLLAKVLNIIERVDMELGWACEDEKWNGSVVIQIQEAATKLGYALATLYNWDCDEESF